MWEKTIYQGRYLFFAIILRAGIRVFLIQVSAKERQLLNSPTSIVKYKRLREKHDNTLLNIDLRLLKFTSIIFDRLE